MLFSSEKARKNIVLLSLVAFSVSMGGSLIQLFMTSDVSNQAGAAETTIDTQLVDAEEGYKIVIQREPNNETALQGLLEARLARKGWQDAKQTLEKLLELDPKNEGYQGLLEEVNAELSQSADVNSVPESPTDVEVSKTPTELPTD